jgi:hypothetical protein
MTFRAVGVLRAAHCDFIHVIEYLGEPPGTSTPKPTPPPVEFRFNV